MKWTAEQVSAAAAIYSATVALDGDDADDSRRGVKLRADKAIASALGCELTTVTSRRLDHGPTFGHVRGDPLHAGRHIVKHWAPPSILADRDARRAALERRDLSATICGDPPPGYSALDRRLR
jgi:hypothetical protein